MSVVNFLISHVILKKKKKFKCDVGYYDDEANLVAQGLAKYGFLR